MIKLLNGEKIELNQAFNCDAEKFIKLLPDKCIDLILTDPPYGIFSEKKKTGFLKKDIREGANSWDKKPSTEMFKEMFRVSKNQIIWGMQYFTSDLPDFTQLLVWDKKTGNNYFADGEAAYCSIKGTLRIFRHQWCGAFKDSERGQKAIHPTQKPIELFKWCIRKYGKENDIIFDPYLGSFTTAIAAERLGFKWIGCEKGKKEFKDGYNRYKQEKRIKRFIIK